MAKVRGALSSSRLPLRYHSSVRGFVGSIRENPFDQARWLVFADWLAENGYEFYERRVRLRVASGKAYDQFACRLSEVMEGQLYLKYNFRWMAQRSWTTYHQAVINALEDLGLKDWVLYSSAYVPTDGLFGNEGTVPLLTIPAPIWGSCHNTLRQTLAVMAAMGLDFCPGCLALSVAPVYPWERPARVDMSTSWPASGSQNET
jgi:uncharacterized protein (TIGR02996 family)